MRSLADWLAYQERQHPQAIDLGLERVRAVWQRMACRPLPRVAIVAGTNGKGTAAHALDALARDAGWHTGRYTSPHLYRYNERICLDGVPVDDRKICAAFDAVEAARGETSLTYFEYGTLAALAIFAAQAPDLVILEVGLGGRLDATNIIDADIAILCSVALDHQDWLGSDLAAIAAEKAAVARPGRPAVVADPAALPLYAPRLEKAGVQVVMAESLVDAGLDGHLPPQSLAAALKAWQLLAPGADRDQGIAVLRQLSVPGRMERREAPFGEYVLDVAHNPAAAQRLVEQVRCLPALPTVLVLGIQRDKDVGAICQSLSPVAQRVFLCDLPPPRGAQAEALQGFFPAGCVETCATPQVARERAESWAGQCEGPARIIIAGSFVTVGECGLG